MIMNLKSEPNSTKVTTLIFNYTKVMLRRYFPGGFFERGDVRLSNLCAKLSRQMGHRVLLSFKKKYKAVKSG